MQFKAFLVTILSLGLAAQSMKSLADEGRHSDEESHVFSVEASHSRAARTVSDDADLPETSEENSFELPNACKNENGKAGTYHDFMDAKMTPKLKALAATLIDEDSGRPKEGNEEVLNGGKAVGVKLTKGNYNFHVNYPENKQGGRSYGWSHGEVGDWSDRAYLDNLGGFTLGRADKQVKGVFDLSSKKASKEEIESFFNTVVKILGKCDTSTLTELRPHGQLVANNFLAIYTAEQYRAAINNSRWDDALLQVTMLGAFHSGQDKLTKYYDGEFSDKSVAQNDVIGKGDKASCPYHSDRKGAKFRDAQMNDYWQLGVSVKPKIDRKTGKLVCTGTSGINPTRKDFEALGRDITLYERAIKKNKTMDQIFEIVGGDEDNVIAAISDYFVSNNAKSKDADKLAGLVSKFMTQIHDHANDTTQWIQDGKEVPSEE